jgi:hypothetical protein
VQNQFERFKGKAGVQYDAVHSIALTEQSSTDLDPWRAEQAAGMATPAATYTSHHQYERLLRIPTVLLRPVHMN